MHASQVRRKLVTPNAGVNLSSSPNSPEMLMSTSTLITVLSNIPWGQVVENAPKVADGAARLWNSVASFRRPTTVLSAVENNETQQSPSETEVIRSQIQDLESAINNLEEQMKASSEVIKALADQNAQLVAGIELNRVRIKQFGMAATSVACVQFAVLIYLAIR